MSLPFVHLELATPNIAKAKEFYGKLCGWTFDDHDMGAPAGVYSMFKPSAGPGGGIYTMEGAPTAWLPYIGVENIKTSTEKAVSLGAKVIVNNQEVPGHGWMSILQDPTGAAIALWQPK